MTATVVSGNALLELLVAGLGVSEETPILTKHYLFSTLLTRDTIRMYKSYRTVGKKKLVQGCARLTDCRG